MDEICYKCHKTKDKALLLIKAENFCICSDCVKELDNLVRECIKAKKQHDTQNIICKNRNCSFCNMQANDLCLQFEDKFICTTCIQCLYEICLENGIEEHFFKKSLANLTKLDKLYLSNEEKFNKIFNYRSMYIEQAQKQIEVQKEWLYGMLGLILIVSLLSLKETLSFSSLICISDLILLFYGLYLGYSALENLKIKILTTNFDNVNTLIKNCAIKSGFKLILLILLFIAINLTVENVEILQEINKDNHLTLINLFPISVYFYALLNTAILYFNPAYLFNLITRKLSDTLSLLKTILIYFAVICVAASAITYLIPQFIK